MLHHHRPRPACARACAAAAPTTGAWHDDHQLVQRLGSQLGDEAALQVLAGREFEAAHQAEVAALSVLEYPTIGIGSGSGARHASYTALHIVAPRTLGRLLSSA